MLKRRLSDYVLRLYATHEYLEFYPPIRSRSDLAKHSLIWYVDHLLNIRSLRDIQIKLDAPGSIQSTNLVAHWQALRLNG